MNFNKIYYILRPFIFRRLQIEVRRIFIRQQIRRYAEIWPIDQKAAKKPKGWKGWPNNKKFALVLTHDVDTQKGQRQSLDLMRLEKELGFISSFNFVPERYPDSPETRKTLTDNGFEIGVHGLIHDGKLFSTEQEFFRRCKKINKYLKSWNCSGFRSPAMHHNLDLIQHLNIEYDASTFDTDPFEPQSDGVSTIYPFFQKDSKNENNGYIELPYTLPQDFTLFILMKEKDIEIWKRKLNWIVKNYGMALVNVHPDYINFNNQKCSLEEYSYEMYKDFLIHIKNNYENIYWNALPRDIASFWKKI